VLVTGKLLNVSALFSNGSKLSQLAAHYRDDLICCGRANVVLEGWLSVSGLLFAPNFFVQIAE